MTEEPQTVHTVTSNEHLAHALQKISIRNSADWLTVSDAVLARLIRSGATRPGPILLWPPFRTLTDLADILPRLNWALPNLHPDWLLLATVDAAESELYLSPLSTPEYLAHPRGSALKIQILKTGDPHIPPFEECSLIAVWRGEALNEPQLTPMRDRVITIDPNFYKTAEVWGINELVLRTGDPTLSRMIVAESRCNFARLLASVASFRIANLFGKGPTLELARNRTFSGELNIVCNSMVQSQEILDHLRPQIIACVDPVFHFGPSTYAARFRSDLFSAAEKYDAYVVVPAGPAQYLMASHYPALRSRLIGLSLYSKAIHIPSLRDMSVKMSASVLTWLMVPTALATNCRILQFWGCDGKKRSETNQFFWARHSAVEYDDLMPTVFRAHPAYFRDGAYEENDRYEELCNYLAEVCEFAEAQNVSMRCCTPSEIPALKRRTDINVA